MAAFVPFETTKAQFYDGFMTSAALAIALHFASTWTGRPLSSAAGFCISTKGFEFAMGYVAVP